MRKCLDCPTEYHDPTGHRKRCKPCRDEYNRNYIKLYMRENNWKYQGRDYGSKTNESCEG